MIPRGTFKKISKESGYSDSYISDLIHGRKKAGRKRAPVLEQACKNLGINTPKELWVFGSIEEIKAVLSKSSKILE